MPNKILGPDGIERPLDEQMRLNAVIASALASAAGKALFQYMRSISTERACGPHASNDEIRHLEGMRYMTAILSSRQATHHQEMKNGGRKQAVRKPAT